jgi:hypothetical protein
MRQFHQAHFIVCIRKYFFLLVLLCAILACRIVQPATTTPTPSDILNETYAVYAVIIQSQFASPKVVIKAQTDTDFSGSSQEDQLKYIRGQLDGLSQATTTDYMECNVTPLNLEAERFPVNAKIILLSPEAFKQFFQENGDGWEAFYAQYPDAQGILSFSAVGFNANQSQALVYAGNQSHWLAGAGYYYLLEKQNGIWVIIEEIMTWIS